MARGAAQGSLFALQWKHVDFDHGTLASFKTKTGAAQYFVGDRGLMALLRAWHEHHGKPGDDDPIIRKADIGCEVKRLARALRGDLRAVGVTRAILFEDDADNVEALRFHDLPSTFCTWARREGKSNAWISERTGHEPTGDMVNRYDRGAQTLVDLEYAPFPDVSRAIPELTGRLATRLIGPLERNIARGSCHGLWRRHLKRLRRTECPAVVRRARRELVLHWGVACFAGRGRRRLAHRCGQALRGRRVAALHQMAFGRALLARPRAPFVEHFERELVARRRVPTGKGRRWPLPRHRPEERDMSEHRVTTLTAK